MGPDSTCMTGRSAVSDEPNVLDPGEPDYPQEQDASAANVTDPAPLSTASGGKPGPTVDGDLTSLNSDKTDVPQRDRRTGDLVRDTLADAQRVARGTTRRLRRSPRRASKPQKGGGYTGAGPDDGDPQPIGGLLAEYVADRGWERPLAEARVFADWAGLVGSDVAAHCSPASLTGGELKVTAESTAWATQLRLLSGTLLARLAAELGPDVVQRLHITGPTGPSWSHGGFSVRGSRGPRDTYG